LSHDGHITVSGAFTILRIKANSSVTTEFLQILLRTEIYKSWLLQFNVGTQYPVIKDDDILNLTIPNIPEEIQKEIYKNVQRSKELKYLSESLLAVAKTAVEIAIEQDEAAAERYIEAECAALGVDIQEVAP